jgi:anaerobic magnesium-protoporphyrin IX monomethyl ester cyclase
MPQVSLQTQADLAAPAPGKPLRIALFSFYNYESHAIRIFAPLLRQRGHEVHTIFFKNYFTYVVPTEQEEDMVVELVERIEPDLVGMSVWSTYFQLAARLSDRIKQKLDPVIIWGGIHAQTKPEDCLQHADIVCKSEGEYVLAELTDRMSLGHDHSDIHGCWTKSEGGIVRNPPRMLIPELDVLPLGDLSSENKYYLGHNAWRDAKTWDSKAVSYDIMAVRGCPFECTFCIHNFTRRDSEGLGTYLRRRSVDHVMRELKAAVANRPLLNTIAFSDDIFGPPRPWLEEFCERYKREIGLPWAVWIYPRMVDEKKVKMMRDAGFWGATIGIQSGSERIRRESYERETSNEEILRACRTLAKHGIVLNLDFIGDNPYETEQDRIETLDLLTQLPKPFYFNFFSLTYFPGVDLTVRALRDGLIRPEDVEDVAEKGYHLWGGALLESRTPEELRWDIVYALAVHGVPKKILINLSSSSLLSNNIQRFAQLARQIRDLSRFKMRIVDTVARRPNLLYQYWANTNRDDAFPSAFIQPNFDNSPLGASLNRVADRP